MVTAEPNFVDELYSELRRQIHNYHVREYKRKNKEKYKVYKKVWKASENGKYHKYKESARSKGYVFELNFDSFKLVYNQSCHYCGKERSKGIDRIDSNGGYSMNNILPCCRTCNVMKMAHSYDDFLKHIAVIYDNLLS